MLPTQTDLEKNMILGIPDPIVSSAYIALILSTVLCVVYGIRNWNREGEISEEELNAEKEWMKEEIEIEEEISGGI